MKMSEKNMKEEMEQPTRQPSYIGERFGDYVAGEAGDPDRVWWKDIPVVSELPDHEDENAPAVVFLTKPEMWIANADGYVRCVHQSNDE